jgi:hypothetical protein
MNEAMHMVQDGNVNNIPVSMNDAIYYYDIYGPLIKAVRDKTTKCAVRTTDPGADQELREQQKMQVLTTDIMHLCQQTFLLSMASLLELTISCPLLNQSKPCIGRQALQLQINLLRSRGFDTNS